MIVGLTYFHFNPRSRAGSDFNPATHYKNNRTFQSTLPCRERRSFTAAYLSTCIFQSTLPCRERQHFSYRTTEDEYFNPRSRAGSDEVAVFAFKCCKIFQSTLPCRERLEQPSSQFVFRIISIHAPVQGATCRFQRRYTPERYFNPRSRAGSDCASPVPAFRPSVFQSTLPCRERRDSPMSPPVCFIFQSTLPCRERPRPQGLWRFPIYISIHAPVQGATAIVTILPHFSIFQSTLPCRERQQKHTNNQFNFLII